MSYFLWCFLHPAIEVGAGVRLADTSFLRRARGWAVLIVPDGLWETAKLLIPPPKVRPQGGGRQDTWRTSPALPPAAPRRSSSTPAATALSPKAFPELNALFAKPH